MPIMIHKIYKRPAGNKDVNKAAKKEKIEEELGAFVEEKDFLGEEKEKPLKKEYEDIGIETDKSSIIIFIAVVIGFFALAIGGFAAYNHFTGQVISIDELHKENFEGNLEEEEGYVYNGYSFVKADGLWWTELNKFGTLLKVPLHFGPKELEDLKITGSIDPSFNEAEKIYVAIDPEVRDKYYTLAISELSFNAAKGMDRIPVGSCTKENLACENRTIVNCENNPERLPVIELAIAPEDKIEIIDGMCIKVSGSEYGLTKGVNRLLYQWYGIMR